MTKFAIILAAAALGGCAVAPQDHYDSRAYAPRADSGEWQVVSVTPVPNGTGARAGASGSDIEYSDASDYAYAPETRYAPDTRYAPAPVYVAPPLYTPAPSYYYPSYWYPPVSIGLGLNFGRSWGSRGSWGGHRGGHRRGR